jgi:hypothetical protein
LSNPNWWHCSTESLGLNKNFSSSVNWITIGTSKTSCNHLERRSPY